MRLPRYFVPDKICGAGHSWQSHQTSCLCSRDCAPLQLVPQRNQKQFKNRSAYNACHVGSGAKQGRDGGGQQHSHSTSKQAVAWGFFSVSVTHTTHCKLQPAFSHVESGKKKEKSYLFPQALLATFYSALQNHYSNCLKLQTDEMELEGSTASNLFLSSSCCISQVLWMGRIHTQGHPRFDWKFGPW